MADNFNFTESGYSYESSNFDFGVGTPAATYTSFSFTETGYVGNYSFNFGSERAIYYILAGTSRNFTSIWADPTANIQTARMYVGTNGAGAALSVVDLEQKVLADAYDLTRGGAFEEELEREDIVDINVNIEV